MSFGGHPPSPPPVQPAPAPDDPAVEQARRNAIIAASKAKGPTATLLTGGMGVTGPAASTERKTLLGI